MKLLCAHQSRNLKFYRKFLNLKSANTENIDWKNSSNPPNRTRPLIGIEFFLLLIFRKSKFCFALHVIPVKSSCARFTLEIKASIIAHIIMFTVRAIHSCIYNFHHSRYTLFFFYLFFYRLFVVVVGKLRLLDSIVVKFCSALPLALLISIEIVLKWMPAVHFVFLFISSGSRLFFFCFPLC